MKSKLHLSVIIPCYNAADTIGEQLQALARQRSRHPWELLVVDNRSRDESRRVAEQFRDRIPRLRIVDAFERQGAAHALNVGVRAAQSDALAFCDADDMVGEGWVAAMIAGLKRHAFVSGPLEVDRLNRKPLSKNRPNPQREGIQRFVYPPYLPHAGAGNMGMRREVYDAVGGFDETLAALFETDFCWKAQLHGTRLTPLKNAVLHQRRRDNVTGLMRQAKKFGEYDVLLYKRYQPLGMPKLAYRHGIKAWLGLALGVPRVMHVDTRAKYLWELSWRAGRLSSSVRNRIWGL